MFIRDDFTNSMAKLIKSLHNSKFRYEEKLFLAEGVKNCFELLNSKYVANTIFLILNRDRANSELVALAHKFYNFGVEVYETKNSIFEKLTDAVSPQPVLAVVKLQEHSESKIVQKKISNRQPILILDNISDPGNVGTIIRTADWFGIKQILLAGDCASVYSPKVVRSTMGSLFKLDIFNETYSNIKNIFNEKKFSKVKIIAATLDAKTPLEQIKISKKETYCLIIGNEARGVSPELENIISEKFIICGYGKAESLNVAVACGISLYQLTQKF